MIRSLLPVCLAATVSTTVVAAPVLIDEPSQDRWMYPSNGTPGDRAQAPTFSALPDAPGLDDRWGFFLFAFDTSTSIPHGLAPSSYRIRSITVTATTGLDESFDYDSTYDSYLTYGTPSTPAANADPDTGRPVALSGAGFRNGFTAASFTESSDYGGGAPGTRNAYPLDFDSSGNSRDVGLNVTDGFEANSWAIGTNDSLQPGDPVPIETAFTFQIDLDLPGVSSYVQQGLSDGRIWFSLHSLHSATQGGGARASWLTRDDSIHQLLGGLAPTLTIEVDLQLPITLTRSGNNSVLSWPEFEGFTHQLHASHDLNDWSNPPIHSHAASTNGNGGFTDVTTETRRFYRIELLPTAQ